MPTRKIKDDNTWRKKTPCLSREHYPPSMMVLEPGAYEHECPSCGAITPFVVPSRPGIFDGLNPMEVELKMNSILKDLS